MVKEKLPEIIRTLRKSRNMTQAELAKLLKQSPSSITMYETGRRVPDFPTLEAIADIFNIPLVLIDDSKIQFPAPKTPTHVMLRRYVNGLDPQTGLPVNKDQNLPQSVSEQRARLIEMAESFPEELIPTAIQFFQSLLKAMKKEV